MSPLTWRVDTGGPTTHVALQGQPDAASVIALRDVLEAHCSRLSGGVTVDLAAIPTVDQASVIPSALPSQYSTMRRGTTALLCPRSPTDTAGTDHRSALHAQLSHDHVRAHQALTAGLLRAPSFHEDLLPVRGAARRARAIVAGACIAWDLPHLGSAATLIASELVSHIVEHVRTMMTVVVLLHDDLLYLWVRSGSNLTPRAHHAGTDLGLVVIHSLAGHWGLFPDGDDTLTWAALPVDLGVEGQAGTIEAHGG